MKVNGKAWSIFIQGPDIGIYVVKSPDCKQTVIILNFGWQPLYAVKLLNVNSLF